jgi:hypothetical protein
VGTSYQSQYDVSLPDDPVHPTTRCSCAVCSHSIPFGTTDYDEQGSQHVAELFLALADESVQAARGSGRTVRRTFPITPNPFHMPGQRQDGSMKLPFLSNGFVTAVFRAEDSGDSPKELGSC